MTNTTLRVRNAAQKILWDDELSGQISDGAWENAMPLDHWKPWCRAEVVVDPANVGRNFYVRKDSYLFTSTSLLEIIGERMIENVVAKTGAPYTRADLLRDLRDLRTIIKTHSRVVAA